MTSSSLADACSSPHVFRERLRITAAIQFEFKCIAHAFVAFHLDCCHRIVLYLCVIVSCCELVIVLGFRLWGHNCQLVFGNLAVCIGAYAGSHLVMMF
jgi:hypothetical protein